MFYIFFNYPSRLVEMWFGAAGISHRWRRVLLLTAGLFSVACIYKLSKAQPSYISGSLDMLELADPDTGLLKADTATALCREHGFSVYPKRNKRRKVYDLFMVNDELDWLEIRLNTIAPEVDYFIIVESPITFQGRPRQLIVEDAIANRFPQFRDKIFYHILDTSELKGRRIRTWDNEDLQRNAMYDQVFPYLQGEKAPNQGDVIVVADVDEIPRPQTLQLLRNCKFPSRLTLRSKFYYYGFQWLHRGPEWAHPQATYYQGLGKTIRPTDLRNGEGSNFIRYMWEKADLWNAGWHCSSCFETVAQMKNKLASFSHAGYNREEFRNEKAIVERVRHGKDLFDRPGEFYDRIENNKDVPTYITKTLDQVQRFGYMLNRDPPNANFKDVHPTESG